MKIAWIGTGVMGRPMVSHLVDKGYEIRVYNRTKEKALGIHDSIIVCDTLEESVRDADIVFSIVGYPKDVQEIYERIFLVAKPGAIFVDMTTSTPKLATDLHNKAKIEGFYMLDAPVTGGEIGAINGTLSIMVGGDYKEYKTLLPVLKLLGKNIQFMGPAGDGQRTKSANQIAVAGALLGTVEALVVAIENHLDLEKVYQIISQGSAASWQMTNNGKKIIDGDFDPGFYIKHFLKDLKIASETTTTKLYGVNSIIKMLEVLIDGGYADEGTQSLIMFYLDKKVYNKI